YSGRALAIWNRVAAFDQPRAGFGFVCGPCFAASARRPVRQIRDFQFKTVPGVWLPRERHALRALDLRLPWLQMQHLAVTVKSQDVALRDHAGVTLLAAFLRCIDVGFNSVVRPV